MSKWWISLPVWVRLVIAVAIVQLVFWFALKPMLFASNEAEFEQFEPSNIAVAPLESPSLDQLENTTFEPIEAFPAWHCCDPGYRALRYNVMLDHVPESGLGIRPRINADNLEVYVNRTFIAGTGRMTLPDVTYNALLRQTYHVPASALEAGDNEFVILMVREASPYFDYYQPIIGEYRGMKEAQSYRMFFLGGYKYLSLGIISLVAVFAAIVALRAQNKREAVWFFCVASSWTLLSLYYVVVDPPLSGNTRLAFYFCASLAVPVSWFGLVNAWDDHRWRYAGIIAVAGFIAVGAAMTGSLYWLPSGPGFDRAGMLHDYAVLAISLVTVLRIIWGIKHLDNSRHWEGAVIILLVTLIALNALTELTSAITSGYLSHTQPFLIVGLAMAFLARNVRLFRSSEQINRTLSTQLAARTSELEEAHSRERALVKHQAHAEERQRIMRDMHDGLGSQLISMLMAARRGKAAPQDMEQGLQQVVDEMRLMIDSMDSVGESLDSALATFKRRLRSRLKQAGFSSEWHREQGLVLPQMGPRAVLQVFRIMQEAVTNALKHSGGDTITVSVIPSPEAEFVARIVVADNGKGITSSAPNSKSRGLRNMETRAASMGARFKLQSDLSGAQAVLDLKSPDSNEENLS